MKAENSNSALLLAVGLAKKAGKVCIGAEICEDAIRHNKAKMALICSDASNNTTKQISNACTTYGVRLVKLDCDKDTLAKHLGKTGYISCVAVLDEDFAKLIASKINA